MKAWTLAFKHGRQEYDEDELINVFEPLSHVFQDPLTWIQPKTPQACSNLSILPTCCTLSTSCNKLVNFIKLQQVCLDQSCCNLSFADLKQLVETSCNIPVEIINLQQFCWQLATTEACWQIAADLLSQAVANHTNACWYHLVVTSCYKMSKDLLQLARFWLCNTYSIYLHHMIRGKTNKCYAVKKFKSLHAYMIPIYIGKEREYWMWAQIAPKMPPLSQFLIYSLHNCQ